MLDKSNHGTSVLVFDNYFGIRRSDIKLSKYEKERLYSYISYYRKYMYNGYSLRNFKDSFVHLYPFNLLKLPYY